MNNDIYPQLNNIRKRLKAVEEKLSPGKPASLYCYICGDHMSAGGHWDETKRFICFKCEKLDKPDSNEELYRQAGKIFVENLRSKLVDHSIPDWAKSYREQKVVYDRLNFKPDPAPPLNVRVAKALGGHVYWNEVHKDWYINDNPKNKGFLGSCHTSDKYDYDTDRDLAMGALDEYCQMNKLNARIYIRHGFYGIKKYRIEIGNIDTRIAIDTDNKSQAICEAIVKHSEGVS